MKYAILILGLLLFNSVALAQNLSDEACEKLLTMAETKPDSDIYTACSFDDELKAWNTWAPFVASHNMKRGIFELCKRYPAHPYGPLYCDKAIELNFGPALIQQANLFLKEGNITEALDYFTRALKTNDLSDDIIIETTEKLGVLYLTKGEYYNPKSAVALLAKAANDGSPLANNALGYLTYSGEHGVKKDHKKSLEYLWRAILHACPAAEENLGAYHLARQKKITENDAAYYMSLQSLSCDPFDKNTTSFSPARNCDCKEVRTQEQFYQSAPYLYLDLLDKNEALLQDKQGNKYTVSVGDGLPNNAVVQEIKPTLITATRQNDKIFLNRYHTGFCVDQCLKYEPTEPKRKPVNIRPYHLTFTKRECADIMYYAKRLIDTTKPFVGKEECLGPEMDEATKLLLQN